MGTWISARVLFPELPRALHRCRNGGLARVGGAADIVLFDAGASTVAGEQWYSKGSNCPFLGHCLPGAVRYTLVDGHISYQG